MDIWDIEIITHAAAGGKRNEERREGGGRGRGIRDYKGLRAQPDDIV